jgi:hypothetical protein
VKTIERKCRVHPEAAAIVFCNKFDYGYCDNCIESCPVCSDPGLYCRHRTYCIIWELRHEAVKEGKIPAPSHPDR